MGFIFGIKLFLYFLLAFLAFSLYLTSLQSLSHSIVIILTHLTYCLPSSPPYHHHRHHLYYYLLDHNHITSSSFPPLPNNLVRYSREGEARKVSFSFSFDYFQPKQSFAYCQHLLLLLPHTHTQSSSLLRLDILSSRSISFHFIWALL